MRIQPMAQNSPSTKFACKYHDLSNKILKSERKDLINLAEIFHTATEKELKQITKSDSKAYETIKSAIDMVNVRKKCYLADGSSFCKQKAKELDSKAATRSVYLQG